MPEEISSHTTSEVSKGADMSSDIDSWRQLAEDSAQWPTDNEGLQLLKTGHVDRLLGEKGLEHFIVNPEDEVDRAMMDTIVEMVSQVKDSEYMQAHGAPYSAEVESYIFGDRSIPTQALMGYAEYFKLKVEFPGTKDYPYYSQIQRLQKLSSQNFHNLYESPTEDNALHQMLQHEIRTQGDSTWRLRIVFDVIEQEYGIDFGTKLLGTDSTDKNIALLEALLADGDISPFRIYDAQSRTSDVYGPLGARLERGSQDNRVVMRKIIGASTGARPELADAYIYQPSRSTMGAYTLDTIAERIRAFGSDKLGAIYDYSGITTLGGYDDAQLNRMHKLATHDEQEIERLKQHDVTVIFINMDGDHNGVASEVASRMDDEAERLVFFEITDPGDIHVRLKQLHDVGISPSTLIFAAHGSPGQFHIGKRPGLDADTPVSYVTTIQDTWFLEDAMQTEHQETGAVNTYGFSIEKANGLIRSIENFMTPSRAIDDPDQDKGRKKIISLSCGFAEDAFVAVKNDKGEQVRGEKTTLLKKLAETLATRLSDEHIDIYGADISTNRQTRTPEGFHYNQFVTDEGSSFYQKTLPHAATVIRVDGSELSSHKLNEVKLRRVPSDITQPTAALRM